jgi:predicted ATPase
MISSISIQGFKSYKSLKDFPLRPLNVLIGPNRSGKTNFLDFWDLLSKAGRQQLSHAINKRGGINSVISWNQSTSLSFELHFEAQEAFLQENGINYEAVITRQQLSYSVTREHLAKRPQKKGLQTSLLTTSAGSALLYNHLTAKQEKQDGQLDSSEFAITQIRDAVAYPTLDKLRRYLTNIAVHRPFNTSDNAPIRNAQLVGVREPDIPPTRLAPGGDNLTNVLYFMHNEPKYQDFYEEYLVTLRRGFPSFEQLIFPADVGQGKTIMAWKDRNVPKRAITANLLSDGTLRFMCLLAALYDPEPPSLLCLDEPEVSLHPQLVRLLVSVLQEASERMQIIVATHSPDLISFLQNADNVVVAQADDGWSTLRRLSQRELEHWLKEYSLGELWESGEIGGRL